MVLLKEPDKNGVFILNLGNSENQIDFNFIKKLSLKLDEIENYKETKSVVITAEGKFFSNGLNLDTLKENPYKLLIEFHQLLLRLLTFPAPIIAAINGHAFAGGAMISFACDYRIMNIEKGYICVNEVEIGFPLTPGLWAIVRSKVNRTDWTDMVLFAKRYSANEALKSKIIHFALPADQLLNGAVKLATKIALKEENQSALRALKQEMYREEINLLKEGLGYAETTAKLFYKKSKL